MDFGEHPHRGFHHETAQLPDGTEADTTVFPVPTAILNLVTPRQALGITFEELIVAPQPVQVAVMVEWFEANYRPGTVTEAENSFNFDEVISVRSRMSRFRDANTGLLLSGVLPAVKYLNDREMLWVPIADESLESLRTQAVDALATLAAIVGEPGMPGRGHNQPVTLVAPESTLEDVRRELQALRNDFSTITARLPVDRNKISAIPKWLRSLGVWTLGAIGSAVIGVAVPAGPEATKAYLSEVAQRAIVAAQSVQAYVDALERRAFDETRLGGPK